MKLSQAEEIITIPSGALIPFLWQGSLQKGTVDSLFRTHNNDYFLSCGVDPIATDVNGVEYGRYHFTSCNSMFSGDGSDTFRVENMLPIFADAGPAKGGFVPTYNSGGFGGNIVLENKSAASSGLFNSILSKSTSNDVQAGVVFHHLTDSASVPTGEVGLFVRGYGDGSIVESARFKNNGDIGFGTNTPDGNFDIANGDTNTCVYIKAGNNVDHALMELMGNKFSSDTGFAFRYVQTGFDAYIYNKKAISADGSEKGHIRFVVGGSPTGWPQFGNQSGQEILTMHPSGMIGVNNSSPLPAYKLNVSGDALISGNAGGGIVLNSPNGTLYRITVSNAGSLSATAV